MEGTLIANGMFTTATGVPYKDIVIPSSVDFMTVRNLSEWGLAGDAAPGSKGYEFFWQRGAMGNGTAMARYKTVTTNAAVDDLILSGGFSILDPSGNDVSAIPEQGAAVVVTDVSNATSPIVLTGNTAGLVASTGAIAGSIVRVTGVTDQQSTQGIDFAIGAVVANTSFTLTIAGLNALATAPGATGTVNGNYRVINYDPRWYPKNRYVSNIVAATGNVSTTVQHGLTPGQMVRFNIPAVSGMTQLNGRSCTVVTVVDDFNFIIDIDTSAFTTFSFPTHAQQPSDFPQMIPFGENIAVSLVSAASQVPSIGGAQIYNTGFGTFADAKTNTGFLGMRLGTGGDGVVLTTNITGPAGGTAGDVMLWQAFKSSFGGL